MNDVSTIDVTIQRAIAAIGADDPNADYLLRPNKHAALLPPEAGALKRILTSEAHKQTQQRYWSHDASATAIQARYKRVGGWCLVATMFGLLIGAIFVLLPQRAPSSVRSAITVIEYTLLFVAFFSGRYLTLARPFPKWMDARAEAELARARLFAEIMDTEEQTRDDELPLLPLKLEYVRRYHLDVQGRYYKKRGEQHLQDAERTKRWERTSFILSLSCVLIALWASLPLLARLRSPMLSSVQPILDFAAAAQIDDGKWLLSLGVMAAALFGFATSRSLMNLDERNALRYLATYDKLDTLVSERLEAARRHAAMGEAAEVRKFTESVQEVMSAEHQEWLSIRRALEKFPNPS